MCVCVLGGGGCMIYNLLGPVVGSIVSLREMDILPGEASLLQLLCSFGSKFFPFILDPFSERTWYVGKKQEITMAVSFVKHGRKSTKCIQSP